MRALVLGAEGTLGKALVAGLPASGLDVVAALGRAACNLTDPESVHDALGLHRPDVVFNAGAYTNVDRAEDEEALAHQINAIGPENVAKAAAARGIRMVHYSTDFVFDGEQELPYDESDSPRPISAYGRTKLEGEARVQAALPASFILRVGCLYGRGGRNFPSTILRRLLAGESLRADGTRKASPTWVVPVVRVSGALAQTTHFGIYHCTANGETTWADYALFLAARLGVPLDRVGRLPYEALQMKAARPRRAILDNRMLRDRDLDTLGTWQEQAEAYVQSELAG